MASKQNPSLFQCTKCHGDLDLLSKTLPCLHSCCRSCLDRDFEGETDGNGQCPECHVPFTLDQLSLAPILSNSFRRLELESIEWKCSLCSGIESTAKNWCNDCRKLFCADCSRFHKNLHPDHNARDLDEMERGEAISAMMTDMCDLHQKAKDLYCKRCNVCLCDTCYQNHSKDSPECSQPLSVREEALKQKSQGPTLTKDMDDLEMSVRILIERTKNYNKELEADCNSKCTQLFEDYEEMVENAKQKTNELCKDMRRITEEQVERWTNLIKENEHFLKQLEIWRLNLHHLLSESKQDEDIVCGLRLLGSKLSSRFQKPVEQKEKCQLGVTFSNWWLQLLKQFQTEKIGSVSLTVEKLSSAKNIVFDKEWNKLGWKLDIRSIHVSKEDDHVFLFNYKKGSVMEFSVEGVLVKECVLDDRARRFFLFDMCSITPDIFVVAASPSEKVFVGSSFIPCTGNDKLIFLERTNIPPYLEIKNIFDTEKDILSLCQTNETIFVCDACLQVDAFTKEGNKLKTIKTGESGAPNGLRIRADPSTGNFWMLTRKNSSELFSFNPNVEKIRSMKIEGKISDFFVDEFGDLYFCNKEGLFSFCPKKQILYKFEKKSGIDPRIFVLKNKIFVFLQIDGKSLIKIFKIFY